MSERPTTQRAPMVRYAVEVPVPSVGAPRVTTHATAEAISVAAVLAGGVRTCHPPSGERPPRLRCSPALVARTGVIARERAVDRVLATSGHARADAAHGPVRRGDDVHDDSGAGLL